MRKDRDDEIPREFPENTLQGFKHPAGRCQKDQTEIDDLETDNGQQGFHDPGAGDIRLIQPQLTDPATYMEGERKANQDGYNVQI